MALACNHCARIAHARSPTFAVDGARRRAQIRSVFSPPAEHDGHGRNLRRRRARTCPNAGAEDGEADAVPRRSRRSACGSSVRSFGRRRTRRRAALLGKLEAHPTARTEQPLGPRLAFPPSLLFVFRRRQARRRRRRRRRQKASEGVSLASSSRALGARRDLLGRRRRRRIRLLFVLGGVAARARGLREARRPEGGLGVDG